MQEVRGLVYFYLAFIVNHDLFPSLYGFSTIKFQFFSVGALSRAFVLWCLVCFQTSCIAYSYWIFSVVSCNILSYSYFICPSPNDCVSYLDSNPIVSSSTSRLYADRRWFDPYRISSSLSSFIYYSLYSPISSSISSFLSKSFDIFPLIFHFHSYPAGNNNNPYDFNFLAHYHDSSTSLSSSSSSTLTITWKSRGACCVLVITRINNLPK